MTSSRTFEPFLPRIISTTLSRRMSRTSTNSPVPWPTAVMRWPTLTHNCSPPALVGFGRIFRPRALFPPKINRPASFKIDRLLEKFFNLADPFVDPPLVEIVDLVSWLEVAQQNVIIERRTIFFGQRIHILLGEKKVTEIEELQIAAQNLARQVVV